MSTTIKRVALVAVAALGLGVLSVAPSQAAIAADSLTLSSATAAMTTADTSTAVTATLKFAGTTNVDSISVQADFVSGPAVFKPYLVLAETSSVTIDGTANPAAGTYAAVGTPTVVLSKSSTTFVSAKWNIVLASPSDITSAPDTAGTYVVKLTPKAQGSGVLVAAAAQTLTITVTKAAALDTVASSATVILNKGETSSATTDAVVTYAKGTSTEVADSSRAAAATLTVALLNAAGKAASESFTATVAGPGILGATADSVATITGGTPIGRAITVKNGHVVQLFNDGSSGVATVTISSALGVVLGTKTVTFYGDAASITAATTALTTGTVAKVGTTAKLITFKVADAAGTNVTTGTYYLASTDSTIISGATTYTACNAWNSTDGFTCDVTGVAKGTANVYVTNRASSTATTPTTEVKSGNVSVRVGSTTPASVTITADKSSYAPGEKATLSVTVKDADGNVVPSGDYTNILKTGGITASYTLGQGSDTTTVASFSGNYALVDGVYAYTLYMPVTEGDVKFSWTTGSTAAAAGTGLATANQAVAGSVTVAVSSVATSAAIDAANEAAQAASDATDAALAAADAADAATTKAQEAVDAVATLSAQVSKMISALRAQLTTLTNLVIKIQKKVRA